MRPEHGLWPNPIQVGSKIELSAAISGALLMEGELIPPPQELNCIGTEGNSINFGPKVSEARGRMASGMERFYSNRWRHQAVKLAVLLNDNGIGMSSLIRWTFFHL